MLVSFISSIILSHYIILEPWPINNAQYGGTMLILEQGWVTSLLNVRLCSLWVLRARAILVGLCSHFGLFAIVYFDEAFA